MTIDVTASSKIPALVGDQITITGTVEGQAPGNIVYRLRVSFNGKPFQIVGGL